MSNYYMHGLFGYLPNIPRVDFWVPWSMKTDSCGIFGLHRRARFRPILAYVRKKKESCFLLGEGSPTTIDYRKKSGTNIF